MYGTDIITERKQYIRQDLMIAGCHQLNIAERASFRKSLDAVRHHKLE